jgi:hypothetical protein
MKHSEGENGQQEAHCADPHGQQVAPHPCPSVLLKGRRQAGDGEYLVLGTGDTFPHRTTICRGACEVLAGSRLASIVPAHESAALVIEHVFEPNSGGGTDG